MPQSHPVPQNQPMSRPTLCPVQPTVAERIPTLSENAKKKTKAYQSRLLVSPGMEVANAHPL